MEFIICFVFLSYLLLYCTRSTCTCAWVRNLVILLEQSTAIYLPVTFAFMLGQFRLVRLILVKQSVKQTTCALVVSYERNKAIIAFFIRSSLVLLQFHIQVSSKLPQIPLRLRNQRAPFIFYLFTSCNRQQQHLPQSRRDISVCSYVPKGGRVTGSSRISWKFFFYYHFSFPVRSFKCDLFIAFLFY